MKLPRFAWTVHNMIAHPLSELFYQLGWKRASNWIHDVTVPVDSRRGEGRG